jgi:hypothetical protein
MREALEFYADRKSWRAWEMRSECLEVVASNDLSFEGFMLPSGGKRARECLAKWGAS